MGMTPVEYFDAFVVGNWADCGAHPGCIRRAFNAAVSASHLADHYFAFHARYHPERVASFPLLRFLVEHVSEQTGGAFRDVRSIANAYKHLYTDLDPGRAAYSTVNSSGSIDSIELAEISDFSRVSEEYEGNSRVVVFTRKDGRRMLFPSVLERTVNYWGALIYL